MLRCISAIVPVSPVLLRNASPKGERGNHSPFLSKSCLMVSSFTSTSFIIPFKLSTTSSNLGITLSGDTCPKRKRSMRPRILTSLTSERETSTRAVKVRRSILEKHAPNYDIRLVSSPLLNCQTVTLTYKSIHGLVSSLSVL